MASESPPNKFWLSSFSGLLASSLCLKRKLKNAIFSSKRDEKVTLISASIPEHRVAVLETQKQGSCATDTGNLIASKDSLPINSTSLNILKNLNHNNSRSSLFKESGLISLTFKENVMQETSHNTTTSIDPNLTSSQFQVKCRSRHSKEIISDYELSKRPLGKGAFAIVYKAISINDGIAYALKFVDKNILKRIGKSKEFVKREIETLKRMKHKNIISLHDVFETKEAVVLVTDFAHGGELLNRFNDTPDFTEQDAVKIMRQLFEGVAYLHSQGIIHRDIKPENLLLKNWTDKLGDAHLLIADFGLARALTSVHESLATTCGTPHFVAPEMMLGKGYSKPVDIWSCGVVMYFLLSGYTPYQFNSDPSSIKEMEKINIFVDEDWREVSPKARSLVRGLLRINPTKRPSAVQALTHPWLAPDDASTLNLLAKFPRNPASQGLMKGAMVKQKPLHKKQSCQGFI